MTGERRITKIDEAIDTHGRLSSLETKSDALKEDINRMMTNHLPHLQAAIDEGRKENNINLEALRKESRENLNGLGTRFENSLSAVSKDFAQTHADTCEKTDRRLDKIDMKFWAIIMLLISTLVAIISRAHV